jgi:hypothetical protein
VNAEEKEKVLRYYEAIRADICKYIDDKMAATLAILSSNPRSDVRVIVKARI